MSDPKLSEIVEKFSAVNELKEQIIELQKTVARIEKNSILDVPLTVEQVKELPFMHHKDDTTIRKIIKCAGGGPKHNRLYVKLSQLCDYLTDTGVISDTEAARLARLSSDEIKRRIGVIQ